MDINKSCYITIEEDIEIKNKKKMYSYTEIRNLMLLSIVVLSLITIILYIIQLEDRKYQQMPGWKDEGRNSSNIESNGGSLNHLLTIIQKSISTDPGPSAIKNSYNLIINNNYYNGT
ncbi:uncharacterized protein LOC126555924 [Aphis gossypii]|uniref:uncharacterized protein LOC126555924 n=1 Tax=Aphis gossypii TaxID=80765 RepID=UPI00215910B7|nr:uncharacterized protein LOC126555924 [Aphis gossypii]